MQQTTRSMHRRGLFPWAALMLSAALVTGAPLHAEETERSITVTGSAETRVTPDMAVLRMAVIEDDPAVDAARARADATIAAALEVLSAAGLARGDVDTSGLRVDPQYRWQETTRERELIGYRVTRGLAVRLLDLELLGELLVALSDAGINQMDAPQLGLADRETVYRRVLAEAAENARQRADLLASTLGEKLGPVRSVNADQTTPPTPLRREMAMMAADAAPAPAASYQSGDIDFRVNLIVSFDLID